MLRRPPENALVKASRDVDRGVGEADAPLARDAAWEPGNRLVQQMFKLIENRPNIAARVRERIQFGEFEVVGDGEYFQQGLGNQRRSRWELQTLVAGQTASLVQVLDGRYLWTDRRMPRGRKVARVDLVRLRRELAIAETRSSVDEESSSIERQLSGARGGLSQLLADLLARFNFSAPQEVRRGPQRAWAVVGHWKSDALAKLWPTLATPDGMRGGWPEQLPHHVLLVAGKDDLFPYVLEYRRHDEMRLAELGAMGGSAVNPLSRFEWFDVNFAAAMDAKYFMYSSGEVAWVDETSRLVSELLPSPPSTAPVASRRKLVR